MKDYTDIAQLLVDAGANIELAMFQDGSWTMTALEVATKHHSTGVLRILVR